MKKRTERWMCWTVAIVLGIQVIGAVWLIAFRPGHNDLLENGTLVLETIPSPGTSLPHAHAVPLGLSLRVSGRIRRTDPSAASERGTLTVTVLSPDKNVLSEVTTNYDLSPSLPHGGGSFSTVLSSIPQSGSALRIQWLASPIDTDRPSPGSQTTLEPLSRSKTAFAGD